MNKEPKYIKQRITPGYLDRAIIWVLTHIKRINTIINRGMGEAYDLGMKRGFTQGAKINGKTSARKARRVLRDVYKDIPKA
jgi:hypothetical protein